MSLPKQPGFPEMSTAELTAELVSKLFITASNSCIISLPNEFTFDPGVSSVITRTPSTTFVLMC